MSCGNYTYVEDEEEKRRKITEWIEKEEEWNSRINIVGQNGATAEGYAKTCVSCKLEKLFIEFPNNSKSPDGKHSYCKPCSNQKNKEWRLKNQEKRRESLKRWKKENVDKIKEYKKNRKPTENEKRGKQLWLMANAEKIKQYRKEYKKNNQKKLSQADKLRKQQDPTYRAICSIRSRVSGLCRDICNGKKRSSTKAIGLARDEFRLYIESLFKEGMTWDNYGSWHIDHIKPLSLAKTEDEVMKLNHYTNLQPLWAIDNLKKSNKYEESHEDLHPSDRQKHC
jgi:hypothetical protein